VTAGPGGKAGDTVEVTRTYLEMTARPGSLPPRPVNHPVALVSADRPPVHYFLYLYGSVGAAYDWTDWFREPETRLEEFVSDPRVVVYTMMLDGWPGGFFMLDWREPGLCDLAYFGLMPEARGRGLGPWLLGEAIDAAWSRDGVERVTVNTCTLDHPAALPLYQKLGFRPHRRETEARVLSQRERPEA